MNEQAETSETRQIELGHLATDIAFVTRILRAHIAQQNSPFYAAHAVANGEIVVLNLIAINPGLTQKDLAQAVVLKKPALTKLVNQFERMGLIERRKDVADMRLNALHLTRAGEERLALLRPAMDNLQQAVTGTLSPAERAMLFELLWRLVGTLGGPLGLEDGTQS